MLQLEAIAKQYRRRGSTVDALHRTSLTVKTGEYIALVGPSGSGKTTMLSMLGGMMAPTRGKILLAGASLYDLSTAARARLRNEKIGFVFQHFNLIPWLSALENVQLPLSLYSGGDTSRHEQHAEELLQRFGLAERMGHRPQELSAGQQQRVALARAMVTSPGLILADEPTGNLDPDSRNVVLEAFAEFHAEGRTIVLVTHDHAVVTVAQRRLQITAGRVEAIPVDTTRAA